MSPQAARPAPALRPFLPADAHALAAIFRASIQELAAEDYSEAQLAAWSSFADDEASFTAHLAGQTTLIASLGQPAGFASLRGLDHVDMLYVHPEFARRGVATALCDALEKIAAARGAAALTVDASDTARPFFERRGYTAEQRKLVQTEGEWLGNTTMKKWLAKPVAVSLQ